MTDDGRDSGYPWQTGGLQKVIHRMICVTWESNRKVTVQHQHLLGIFSVCVYDVFCNKCVCLATGKSRMPIAPTHRIT